MLEYWLWLTGRRGVGLRGLRALLEQFGTPEAVYCAAEQDYPQALRQEGRASLADKELAPARQILQQCYRKNIHVLTFQDAAYPNRLKNLDDAPLVLYYQGVFPDFDAEPVIAMVGTRKASAYGLLQAKRLGYELGRYGAIIVSGGAAGIDTMALRGPYPPEQRRWLCLPAAWISTIRQTTGVCLRIFAPTAASSVSFRPERRRWRSIFRPATAF